MIIWRCELLVLWKAFYKTTNHSINGEVKYELPITIEGPSSFEGEDGETYSYSNFGIEIENPEDIENIIIEDGGLLFVAHKTKKSPYNEWLYILK